MRLQFILVWVFIRKLSSARASMYLWETIWKLHCGNLLTHANHWVNIGLRWVKYLLEKSPEKHKKTVSPMFVRSVEKLSLSENQKNKNENRKRREEKIAVFCDSSTMMIIHGSFVHLKTHTPHIYLFIIITYSQAIIIHVIWIILDVCTWMPDRFHYIDRPMI